MKINKKVLIISLVVLVLVVVVAGGLLAYKSIKINNPQIQEKKNTENKNAENKNADNKVVVPDVQVQVNTKDTSKDQAFLTVCLDNCGDGICQKIDTTCEGSGNCICPETFKDCPKDCPNN